MTSNKLTTHYGNQFVDQYNKIYKNMFPWPIPPYSAQHPQAQYVNNKNDMVTLKFNDLKDLKKFCDSMRNDIGCDASDFQKKPPHGFVAEFANGDKFLCDGQCIFKNEQEKLSFEGLARDEWFGFYTPQQYFDNLQKMAQQEKVVIKRDYVIGDPKTNEGTVFLKATIPEKEEEEWVMVEKPSSPQQNYADSKKSTPPPSNTVHTTHKFKEQVQAATGQDGTNKKSSNDNEPDPPSAANSIN